MTDTDTFSSSAASSSRNPLNSIAVHIEVRLHPDSTATDASIRAETISYLSRNCPTLTADTELLSWPQSPFLSANVDRIRIAEISSAIPSVPTSLAKVEVHVYQPPLSDIVDEFSAADPSSDDTADETTAASVSELPNRTLDGVWDTLVYSDGIKPKLLNYIYTTLLFSDANVNFNLVSWNRVVLLHGPPGTGKTSLCKALAQKLAIRLSHRYTHGKLVEINSHSLFSKWFSESGKLVQRLFSMITEMVEDDDAFVVVLIDEVESLTADRSAAADGSEPTDSIRVVNALLTQLDKLKHRKNVLIMTTSNLCSSIDDAFLDRADIKQYVGLPPPKAIYWILQSCLRELIRVALVAPVDLPSYEQAEKDYGRVQAEEGGRKGVEGSAGARLLEIAHACQGLSGRSLRRLPVLAHAHHIGMAAAPVEVKMWLEAMDLALREIKADADDGRTF
ncbi:related to PCH2 - putative ATPase [Melanopsichium pennsylvanicum]|uniref:Related to PCH2 - putative ATPase n=2 Tax=Melanopsichium pennsylvanicum TaxID=63383 RepID=A0AAJ4XP80_9BASI|nr:related to PCH2-putative ATPase [Melanopsichium pennsylvanicum 4]SNX86604.1 related to PCH2 - putative ATPase [Melanopsichium pennsylvanicum]